MQNVMEITSHPGTGDACSNQCHRRASVEQEDWHQGTFLIPRVSGMEQPCLPPHGLVLRDGFEKAPKKEVLRHYFFGQRVTKPSF